MAPIRVGIIGLSSITPGKGAYTAGTWGQVHLAGIVASPHYKVVALCNSSVEAARKSVEHNKLDPSTKTYGSPEDLAQDPDVDLVVVSVQVGKHYALAKPSLLQKKHAFIEFPIAPTLEETAELAEIARKAGVRTVSGAQAAAGPVIKKTKELIKSKAIGDVVSTSLIGHSPLEVWKAWPERLSHYLDLDYPSNSLTVGLGHALDLFIHVLGDFTESQAVFKINGKTAPLINREGKVVNPAYKVTSPDTVLLQGVLESGAAAAVTHRTSAKTVDGVGFRWIISGTEGELELTGPVGYIQQVSAEMKLRLRVGSEEAKEVEIDLQSEPDYIKSLPPGIINTGRAYEAFATKNEDGYSTLETGFKVQRLIEQVKKNAVWAP